MQAPDPPQSVGAPATVTTSPPRAKPAFLASLAIPTFAAFRSQTSQPAPPQAVAAVAQSPVRRKPLPLDSPVVGRYLPPAQDKLPADIPSNIFNRTPPQGARVVAAAARSPAFDDAEDDFFFPRNLDE